MSRQSIYNWAAWARLKLYQMPGLSGPTGEPVQRVMRSDLERLLRQRRAKK